MMWMIVHWAELSGRFGSVVLEAAAKGLVWLMLAWGVVLVMRKSSAATKHAVWTAAMMGLLVMPLAMWGLPGWRVVPGWVKGQEVPEEKRGSIPLVLPAEVGPSEIPREVAAIALPAVDDAGPPEAGKGPVWTREATAGLVLWVWAMGVATGMGRLGWASWELRLLRKESREVTVGWASLVRDCAMACGLKRRVQVALAERMDAPMAFGIWQAWVVLPAEAERWTMQRKTLVLMHEFTHVARRDATWQAVAAVVRAVHWINPMSWIVFREMEKQREKACDDRVVVMQGSGGVAAYAEALVDIAERCGRREFVVTGLGMARKSTLEWRVRGVLASDVNRRSVGPAVLVLWCLLMSMGSGLVGCVSATKTGQGAQTMATRSAVAAQEKANLAPRDMAAMESDAAQVRLETVRAMAERDAAEETLERARAELESLSQGIAERGNTPEMAQLVADSVKRFLAAKAQVEYAQTELRKKQAMLAERTPKEIVPADVELQPGEHGEFYLYGDLPRPGVYALKGRKATVKQALAAAGLGFDAEGEITLVRRVSLGAEKTVRINLRAMYEGIEPDRFLQDNDVVEVKLTTRSLDEQRQTLEKELSRLKNNLAGQGDRLTSGKATPDEVQRIEGFSKVLEARIEVLRFELKQLQEARKREAGATQPGS